MPTNNASVIFRSKILRSAALYIILYCVSVTTAFSPEIFNRIVEQLGSVGQNQVDKIASTAAEFLDGGGPTLMPQTSRQVSVSDLLQPPAAGRIQFPKLAPTVSVYDYETTHAKLDLTPQEEALIRLLQNVRNKHSKRSTVRIAGGWVRDKLIYGKATPSRDVDLVLSDTTGKDFAAKVCQYVEEAGEGDGGDAAGAIVRVQQPSSGKGARADHLQTASLRIGDFDVDFGCLRYERYDPDSRIPANCRVASAVEDAWRRDLTINALYYNLNTNEVEDYTERGVRDLISQTIATPKRPLPTLLEDPMRILRAVRFAAQLSFDVSPALIRAARDERVRAGLRHMVSRDAIGASIDEMLGTRARDPARGIRLLMTTDLMGVVFPLGDAEREGDMDRTKAMTVFKIGLEILSRTQSLVTKIFQQSPGLEWDISKRRLLWYAAFFKPIYDMGSADTRYGNSSGKRRRRQESVFYRLLVSSLKRPKTDVQEIENILKGVDPIHTAILTGRNNDAIQAAIYFGNRFRDVPPQSSRQEGLSELRWIVYQALKPSGAMWKEALLLGLASSQNSMASCIVRYSDLVSLVEGDLHLKEILRNKNEPKPMLKGDQIQRVFRGQINGRDFKDVVGAMEEWQIRNICFDIDSVGDDKHSQMEAQLIDYLLDNFPEYANIASVQPSEE